MESEVFNPTERAGLGHPLAFLSQVVLLQEEMDYLSLSHLLPREASRKTEESKRGLAMFFITMRVKRVEASCSL